MGLGAEHRMPDTHHDPVPAVCLVNVRVVEHFGQKLVQPTAVVKGHQLHPEAYSEDRFVAVAIARFQNGQFELLTARIDGPRHRVRRRPEGLGAWIDAAGEDDRVASQHVIRGRRRLVRQQHGQAPGLGDLELATLSSHLTSFRPPDELILSATGISGVSAFIELVDKDAAQSLRDPLREEIAEALG